MVDYTELISKMTDEEKASLCSGADFWHTKGVSRLGIPQMMLTDGPHGLRKQIGKNDHLGLNAAYPATCFPTASAAANSWDEAMIEQMGRRLGAETRAQRVGVILGPGVNIKRSPLCGRNFEYYSEDPLLAGKCAAALIRGVQSNGIAACVKHFAANSQETLRMTSDSVMDERTLREIYLPAFEIAVKEGRVKCLMTSYNMLNGQYTNENEHLLQDILTREWGYDGLIVTDWGGDNDRVRGLIAGNSLEMPGTGGETDRQILEAVQSGAVERELLDERVARLLRLVSDAEEAFGNAPGCDMAEHHEFAARFAEECAVLLKNEDGILPLRPGARIAVIGDFAKTPRYQGAGSSMVNSTQVDVLLDMDRESITDLNALAQVTEDFSDEDIRKLGAVVTMARPRTAEQVKNLVENLDLFDFAPDAHTLEEYGKYMIRQSGHFDYDENLDDFYDYEKYGFQRMNEEDGMFTDRGYIAYKGYSSLREIMNGDQSSHMKMGDMT